MSAQSTSADNVTGSLTDALKLSARTLFLEERSQGLLSLKLDGWDQPVILPLKKHSEIFFNVVAKHGFVEVQSFRGDRLFAASRPPGRQTAMPAPSYGIPLAIEHISPAERAALPDGDVATLMLPGFSEDQPGSAILKLGVIAPGWEVCRLQLMNGPIR